VLTRRQLLGRAGAAGIAAGMGTGFWERALGAPAQPGDSPYGPLLPPDGNGLMLPAGFTSRMVAASLTPVAGTTFVWHPFPDGGACVPTDDGGWIYVSNSENPPPVDVRGASALVAQLAMTVPDLPTTGGVGAIRFDRDGHVVEAYSILDGSQSNCAGGLTPWGTWLSCEEWEDKDAYDAGKVWECDPFGAEPAVVRPSLGVFKHEMVAVDPERHRLYLTEDQTDGLLYRYTPPAGTWGSGAALEGGTVEAMAVADGGAVTWLPVAGAAAPSAPLRGGVPGATTFAGGEGAIYDDGRIYITTKGDNRVWLHDIEAETMAVLYDAADHISPVLTGVDNLAVSAAHDLYVAEDGGNLEVCVITPERAVFPLARMTGNQHGFDSGTPIPFISEVTGLALSPDGNRLYFNSERGMAMAGAPTPGPGPGILYEITGPFRGGTLAAGPAPAASAPAASPAAAAAAPRVQSRATGALPATGGDGVALGAAAVATAAAGALWHLRQRSHPTA